nr:MAG TPA: hypothetical protein [Caudoviricetes sp.]
MWYLALGININPLRQLQKLIAVTTIDLPNDKNYCI